VDDQDPKPPPDEQSAGAVPEGGGDLRNAPVGDGRIPPHLREWILAQFPDDELDRSLEELDETKCLELAEFLDLEYWEQEAAREQAKHKR
jgi:hypothetical protein